MRKAISLLLLLNVLRILGKLCLLRVIFHILFFTWLASSSLSSNGLENALVSGEDRFFDFIFVFSLLLYDDSGKNLMILDAMTLGFIFISTFDGFGLDVAPSFQNKFQPFQLEWVKSMFFVVFSFLISLFSFLAALKELISSSAISGSPERSKSSNSC